MFTGIVQGLGEVTHIQDHGGIRRSRLTTNRPRPWLETAHLLQSMVFV